MRVYFTSARKLHGDRACGHNPGGGVRVFMDEDPGTAVCRYCGKRARRLSFFDRVALLFGGGFKCEE